MIIMKNFIYSLSDPITKEIVYIGKTKNPIKRHKDHCRSDIRNRCNLDKWKNEIINQGLSPVMKILEEVYDDVNGKEKFYINFYLSNGCKLLNMTEGGDGLQNPSEEVRKKIGDKSRGRKMSDYTRKKIFDSTYNGGNPILCYDKSGNFKGQFKNARRAQEKLGVGYKSISAILNGKRHFIKGYTFFLEGEEEIEKKIEERLSKTIEFSKKFYRISESGDIKEYDNLIKASQDNDCNYKNIWLCLNNQRKTCNGFAWSYESIFDLKYFKKNTNSKKCRLKSSGEIILFESLEEATKFTGLNKSTICNYLKNKIKPSNGDIWDYV